MSPSPFDPDTHYEIVDSDTPHTDDGYWPGEPKALRCAACGAEVLLTEQPSPGIDDGLPHDPDCPQRFARTEWWRSRFHAGD